MTKGPAFLSPLSAQRYTECTSQTQRRRTRGATRIGFELSLLDSEINRVAGVVGRDRKRDRHSCQNSDRQPFHLQCLVRCFKYNLPFERVSAESTGTLFGNRDTGWQLSPQDG